MQHHNHLKARLIQREKSHHQLEKKANMVKRPNLGFHRIIKTNTTIDTIQLAKTNVTSHIDSKFLNEDKEVHFNVQSFIEEFICQAFKFIQFYIFPFFIHSKTFIKTNLYQLMSFQPFDCLGALLLITLHLLSLIF